MCSRKLKGRSALRAEKRKRCCCSPFTIQGLTGYSPFRSRNVEKSFSGTQVHLGKKKKTPSVCDEENYWFPCSLNGGHVLRQRGRVQVGFFFFCLSSLPSICLSAFCLYSLYPLCSWFTSPCLAGRFSLLGSEPRLRRTYASKPGAWIKFLCIVSVCFKARSHTSTPRGLQIPRLQYRWLPALERRLGLGAFICHWFNFIGLIISETCPSAPSSVRA